MNKHNLARDALACLENINNLSLMYECYSTYRAGYDDSEDPDEILDDVEGIIEDLAIEVQDLRSVLRARE